MPETLPLRDIIAIEPGWWPPAPVWWLLTGIGLVIMWRVSQWLVDTLRYQYAPLKKAALSELEQIKKDTYLDDQEFAEKISSLLKRVALQRFPDKYPARLSGENWLSFLDSSISNKPFRQAGGACLAMAQYQPFSDLDRVNLVIATQQWIYAI